MLYDVDKESVDRSNPSPNTIDVVLPNAVKAHETVSTSYSGSGTTLVQRLQLLNNELAGYDTLNNKILSITPNKFLYSDGSNKRVLMGTDSTGNEVVKISKPGFDADTTADANLIFNSNQNVFKIVSKGTATIPLNSISASAGAVGSNTLSTTIAHGLGYTPTIIAYYATSSAPGTLNPLPNFSYINTAGTVNNYKTYNVNYTSDATNLIFSSTTSIATTSGGTISLDALTVYYYILQETAN